MPAIDALARPRIVFTGAVVESKLDFSLIVELARASPDSSIVLVGPVGPGDPSTDVGPLRAEPNIHLLGRRDYEQLPAILRGADVAIIPYARNTLTASIFPMKVYEYLAAGLTVLATRLPSLEGVADVSVRRHGRADGGPGLHGDRHRHPPAARGALGQGAGALLAAKAGGDRARAPGQRPHMDSLEDALGDAPPSSPASERPLVTIVAVNYNGAALVERFLNGVRGSDYEPLELIVVDNASSDESAELFACSPGCRAPEEPREPGLRAGVQPGC